MADTIRDLTALLALFADNTSGNVSPQDARDFIVSVVGALFRDTNPVTATPYNLTTDDIVVLLNANSADVQVNLPAVADYRHRFFVIVKTDNSSNVVNISPKGSETINGLNDVYPIALQWGAAWVWAADVTASDWVVIAQA